MTRDANEIARDHERSESKVLGGRPINMFPTMPTPRYGRMIGALTHANHTVTSASTEGELRWDDVSVQPFADGYLLLEDRSGVRTIVNLREFLFLEFRPDDEGE